MKTKILIMLPDTVENYRVVLNNVKDKVVSYFGTKFAEAEEIVPVVTIKGCEVTKNDLQELYNGMYKDIILVTVINFDSKQIEGDIISLIKED